MRQQVNLYQPMFRRQEKVFSAVTMLQIIVFFSVVFGAVYAYNVWKLQPFQKELTRTTAEYEKMFAQLEALQKKIPAVSKATLIENEIARLTKELEQSKRLREMLSRGSFGNVEGFSTYFEALAKGHIDGAWLTGIHIREGGEQLSFKGLTIEPDLVPRYIKKLSVESIFNDRRFNILEMERMEERPNYVSFNISTGNG